MNVVTYPRPKLNWTMLVKQTDYIHILWSFGVSIHKVVRRRTNKSSEISITSLGVVMIVLNLKFDRHLGSAAVEVSIEFQIDWKSLNPNLGAMLFHEILR